MITTGEEGLIVDVPGFAEDVGRFALLTGRSFGEELKVQGKGAMKVLVRITPPFSGGEGGRSAADAKKAGLNAISRDMHRVFRAVELKGERKVTHLFGKAHPAAPWTVPAPEKHPQVAALYGAHKKLDTKARNARYRQPLYVDAQKFRSLQAYLDKRVGFLGGGFSEAAKGLGVPMPSFMSRHAAAPGALIMKLDGDELYIIIRNDVRYANVVHDFARRVEWALQTQRGKMERQIPYLLKRHEALLN